MDDVRARELGRAARRPRSHKRETAIWMVLLGTLFGILMALAAEAAGFHRDGWAVVFTMLGITDGALYFWLASSMVRWVD